MKGELRFSGVRKVYRWRGSRQPHESVKGALLGGRWRRRKATASHVALDGIDLTIEPGEAVALIGPNGSGKSTLLKLAGGILRPTEGTVVVDGRVTALIELGAGFHPEITGRENVVINGMLLGLDRREVERRLPEIVDFAGIGDFIDEPVKTYSSGMYVRLGFAVAVAVNPDILLIDEVLAVGDEAFTRRCLDRLARMRRAGVTMVLVSHDLELVEAFAERAVYLRAGRIRSEGPTARVIARYRADVAGAPDRPDEKGGGEVRVLEEGRRWGSGEVEIVSVALASGAGAARLVPTGSPCALVVTFRVHRPVGDAVVGVAWSTADGVLVTGHNTDLDGLGPQALEGGGEIRCAYPALDLAPGDYSVDIAIHTREGHAYDYWCGALAVRVTGAADWPGVWNPARRWERSGAGE
ncbi:MAG: ABC transporter ATP-binding protein [Thermoanaerobaculales bacterium]|nr:ABC transporter ATP-binding protein [Thermoanaerobaculales bacterium]